MALAAAWGGGPWFASLVVLAAGGMGWEWARLTGAVAAPATALTVAATVLPVLALAFGLPGAALALVAAGGVSVWAAARSAQARAPSWAALGVFWIALPSLACLRLGADPGVGRDALLWLFATVWASDTGAFVAGRWIGGPRLAPRLSPNKTWSGAVGGAVAAALVGLAAALLAGAPAAAVVPAGIVLGIATQLGDLAESLAKRRFGIKDASGLIPGHGGLLDRLDGMLAAASVQFLITMAAGASPLTWRV